MYHQHDNTFQSLGKTYKLLSGLAKLISLVVSLLNGLYGLLRFIMPEEAYMVSHIFGMLEFIPKAEQNALWREMDWEELWLYDTKSRHYPSWGYPGNGIPVNGLPSPGIHADWLKGFSDHLVLGERVMNKMKAQQIAAERRLEMWQADTERIMAGKHSVESDDEAPENLKCMCLSPSPDTSLHWFPPGHRCVQTQPSVNSLFQNASSF